MRVLICGSRDWGERDPRDMDQISDFIATLDPKNDSIVSGGSGKVDTYAAETGRVRGIPVEEVFADWAGGKTAGSARNYEMIKRLPDEVVAFWDRRSRGTKDMISQATFRQIPVTIIEPLWLQEKRAKVRTD